MSLNPSGTSVSWNFSNVQRDGYSLEIFGTVVSLQEVQGREYNPNTNQPGRPAVWPDGNPRMNIRMGLAMPDGSLKSVTFPKAGKKQRSGEKPSLHMQLFNLTNNNMMELIGKTLHIWTWPCHPETSVAWGNGNPRLFGVEEITDGTKYALAGALPPEFQVPELYCNDGAAGGQPIPAAPQQIQQPQVPPMQGGFYAAPAVQPQPQMQQPMQYQQPPMQYQPAPAPAPQQMAPAPQAMQQPMMAAPMPQGMDPAVAAAMQAVGAVNVQPVQSIGQPEGDPTGGIYDDGIPF